MVNIIINPGTGKVPNATEENAIENMKHFIVDCGVDNLVFVRFPKEDEDGRYHFLLFKDECTGGLFHRIDMPGLPLDKVRYMDSKMQNIWDFPRLYVDGSSWVWMYSLLSEKSFEFNVNDED